MGPRQKNKHSESQGEQKVCRHRKNSAESLWPLSAELYCQISVCGVFYSQNTSRMLLLCSSIPPSWTHFFLLFILQFNHPAFFHHIFTKWPLYARHYDMPWSCTINKVKTHSSKAPNWQFFLWPLHKYVSQGSCLDSSPILPMAPTVSHYQP